MKSMSDATLNITYTEAVWVLQAITKSLNDLKVATETDDDLDNQVISIPLVKDDDEMYVKTFPNPYVIAFTDEGGTSIIIPDDEDSL